MPRYAVYGSVTVSVSMEVEAEDEEAAIEAAEREWPGLSGYVGNGGGGDRLLGPAGYENNEKVEEVGDEPKWNAAVPIGEEG